MNQQNVTEINGAWLRDKLQLSPDDLTRMRNANPSECWEEETATGLTVHLGGGVIRDIVTVPNEPPNLSLVPMPSQREYSEPDAALDADAQAANELDPFDSFLLLCRTLHEVEVLAPAVGKYDADAKRAIQGNIARAIEALQTLQAAPLSKIG